MSTFLDPTEVLLSIARQKQQAAIRAKMPHLTVPESVDLQARERVAEANAAALVLVLLKTGVTIRAAEYSNWRPTRLVTAELVGIVSGCTILATDGNLGLFAHYNDDGESFHDAFFGHIQHFDGRVQTLFGIPQPYHATEVKKKKPSKEQQSKRDVKMAAKVMELLKLLDDED